MATHIEETASRGQYNGNSIRGGKPLFLVGPPRSGTTLQTRILNAHPNVLLTNETAVFMQLAHMVEKSSVGAKAGILFGKQYHELWSGLLKEYVPALIGEFYDEIADQEGKEELSYWGEKHPHLSMCLPFLKELYPEATYIYAIRDPRDTACSMAEMNGVSFEKALDNWSRFSNKYEAFLKEDKDSRIVVVRYEDLVADYEGATSGLFEKLGLSVTSDVYEFIGQYKDVDSHQVLDARGWRKALGGAFQRRKFASESMGRWRRELDASQRRLAEKTVGDFLEKYGYPR